MPADRDALVAANRARMLAAGSPSSPPANVPPVSFTPEVCPRCGYSLAGLPAVGTCPECGRAYDDQTIYLYGHPPYEPPRSSGRLWFGWVGVVVAAAVVVLTAVYRHGLWTYSSAWAGWLPGTVLGLIAATWRRSTGTDQRSVRVTLGPAGVSQRRRSFGPIPFARADRVKLVPWQRVARASVQPVGPQSALVHVAAAERFWTLRGPYVLATVEVSPARIAAIRDRIARWRAAAG